MSVDLEYLRTEFSSLNQLIFGLDPSLKSYESDKGNIDLEINQKINGIQKLISESETSFNSEITQLRKYSQEFPLTLKVIKPDAIRKLLGELEIFEVGILNKLAASQESDSKINRKHGSDSSPVSTHSLTSTSSVSTQEKEDSDDIVKAILLRSKLGVNSLPVEKLTVVIVRQRIEDNLAFLRKILPLPEIFSTRPEWLEKIPEGTNRELMHYKEYFGDSHIPTSVIILNAYRDLTPQEQQSNLVNLRNVLLDFCEFIGDTYREDLKSICNHHIKLTSARKQFSIKNLYDEISRVLNDDSGEFEIRALFREDEDYENVLFPACSYAYFTLLMRDYRSFRTLKSLKYVQALFKGDPEAVVDRTEKVNYINRMINIWEPSRTASTALLPPSSEHKG